MNMERVIMGYIGLGFRALGFGLRKNGVEHGTWLGFRISRV